jgi:hypothetical protein
MDPKTIRWCTSHGDFIAQMNWQACTEAFDDFDTIFKVFGVANAYSNIALANQEDDADVLPLSTRKSIRL